MSQQPTRLSPLGLALIKGFEGFRERPSALGDGRFVWGYGHAGEAAPAAPLTAAEAEELLQADLAPIIDCVAAQVLTPISQNQFDALVSFGFSIGLPAFERSDVLMRLNAGEPLAAANAFDAWRRSRMGGGHSQVLDALVRRRAAEKALFLEQDPRPAAPSALVRPEIDHAWALLGAPEAAERALGLSSQSLSSQSLSSQSPGGVARAFGRMFDPAQAEPPVAANDESATPGPSIEKAPVRGGALQEAVAFAGLGVFGLLLIATGVSSAVTPDAQGGRLALALFIAPGVLAVLMSGYYLLKRATRLTPEI